MLDFTVDLAYRAGALLRAGLERQHLTEHKGQADLVTDIDRASEALLFEALHTRFPDHRILAEEGSAAEGNSPYTWLIDPLDGTTNYAHGYPVACVSLGLLYDDQLHLGVVYDPFRNELFAAEQGQGAFCNGRRLQVSATKTLHAALLSTGFPYDRFTNPDNNIQECGRMLLAIQGIRRSGSAALDLCYVAAGRSDGHWELGLHPWDVAAGALLLREAGGQLSDWQNQPWTPWNPRLVATNGHIHQAVVEILQGQT